MIGFREIACIYGLDGNFYFRDFTNEISFILVRNIEEVSLDFFDY